jgi:DNA-binding SARP family transcriptional activator
LGEALALWRGPALAGVAADVLAGDAARLEESRMMALERRINADLALGRHHGLVPELEALVRANPLREGLLGQLMVALYRAGRQADALAVYRRGRARLAEELGIDPGPALQALEVAVLRQSPEMPRPVLRPGGTN